MRENIKVLNHVDFDEWQEIADKCEYATFFHTPIWSTVFAETYPNMEIATKKFVFDDGMTAILPLVKNKTMKGLFDAYISNVAEVYGGWISDGLLSHEHGSKIIRWISKNLKNLIWRINPFDASLKEISIPNLKQDFTHYLDLRHGFDPIYKNWRGDHASAVRRARKEGVVIEEAHSWNEWKQYFEIYKDSIRRWGSTVSSRYPISLFEKFFNQHSPNIKLWFAYFENKPIAGALCFYHNHHVVCWHCVSLERYFKKRPSHLLQYEITKDACDKGYWWYDLNPSGGHKGVVRWKRGFGVSKLETNVIITNSVYYRLANKAYSIMQRLYE